MTFAPAEATRARFALAAIAAAVSLAPAAAYRAPGGHQQAATFKSNINMLAVDVLVVNRDGQPILGLLAGDFTVSINNHPRRIVSADLVQYSDTVTPPPLGTVAPPASLLTPGRVPDDGRVFVIAVDDASFSTGGIKPALQAAARFVGHLRPSDMVGLYVYPFERPRLDLTHNHRAVRDALGQLMGRRLDRQGEYQLSPAEVMDITAGDRDALDRVVAAECRRASDQLADAACPDTVRAEASMVASYYESEASQRIYGLGMLIQDLGYLPGRKTVVIVSGGMLAANRIGGRPDVRGFMGRLGEQAARSNVSTYVVHQDDGLLDAFTVTRPSRRATDRTRSAMAEAWAFAGGLERLASEAGGVYLPVKAGTGDLAFGRVLRETMAYYLLGVEPTLADWNGKKLLVSVKTNVRGATVRALREVIAR